MLKKKKPTYNPNDHDFTALDAAVSELSKQTEALLGKTSENEKASKPKLPKKHTQPQAKGRSFDIIHDPAHKTRLKATLKSVKAEPARPAIAVSETAEIPVLLPDHGTKSFNEVEAEPEKPAKPPEIIQHREGKLDLGTNDQTTLAEDITAEPSATPASITSAHVGLTFDDEASEAEETPTKETVAAEVPATVEIPAEKTESEDKSKAKDESVTETPVEVPAYTSGELYANNLVKETKPKGYQPKSSEDKPVVFDTEEYHPELHDWSKLEQGSGAKWVLLILLLIVAGGIAWFVLTNQTLPF